MLTAVLVRAIRSFAAHEDQLRLFRSCSTLAQLSNENQSYLEGPAGISDCWIDGELRHTSAASAGQNALQSDAKQEPWTSFKRQRTHPPTAWTGLLPSSSSDHIPVYDRRSFTAHKQLLCGLPSMPQHSNCRPSLSIVRQFSGVSPDTREKQNSTHGVEEVSEKSGVIETATPPSQQVSWLVKVLPKGLLPYALLMRLDKPIGTWLLAWPCLWAIALAAPTGSLPDIKMIALFGTGSLLLRGAGCTVNDLWDQDLDRKVERTRGRPLASGALTTQQGIGLLGAQLLLGLGILVQLNNYSILLGASSLALVFTYPLMKRITFWPQAFLGLTFNWGALLGYAAVQGSCNWPIVVPLYLGGVCWTLVYDTIYAHQDKVDDISAGVKSTALLFGENTRPWLTSFAFGATGLWTLSGHTAGLGGLYFAGTAAAGCHMLWQIWKTNLDSRDDCMASFVSNKWMGGMMFSGIVLDKLM